MNRYTSIWLYPFCLNISKGDKEMDASHYLLGETQTN